MFHEFLSKKSQCAGPQISLKLEEIETTNLEGNGKYNSYITLDGEWCRF